MIFQNSDNFFRNPVHGLIAIYGNEPSGPLIIIGYRSGHFPVGLQPWANYFQTVVIAGNQLRAVAIANAIDTWRLEVDVIDPPTGGTRTAPRNPEQQLIT